MLEKNSPKREQLLTTASDLFWKYGMKRVPIEEICKEANVSKMTFYKYFKNKNDLAKTIIDKMHEDAIQKYRSLSSRSS